MITLPAAALEEWYAQNRHDDDALFDELGRLDLDAVPPLPGVIISVDKMGRITASLDGRIE